MTTTDPTITIAGLRAQVESLIESIGRANSQCASFCDIIDESRSVVARVEAERDALAAQLAEVRKVAAELDRDLSKAWTERERAATVAERDNLRAALASERAHLAACQTRIAGLESAANERSAEVARLAAQLEAARKVIDENRAHAEGFARDLAIAIRERDEERATVARLTARVAELEARPVLTVETLAEKLSPHMTWGDGRSTTRTAEKIVAALGPVTLPPAQDRAEELLSAFVAEHGALLDRSINGEAVVGDVRVVAMSRALASLGAPPTSPPAARPVFAGVSEEELDAAFEAAYRAESVKSASGGKDPRRAAIRAVLARLEVSLVAPVDPEAVAIHVINDMATRRSDQASWTGCTIGYQSAVTAAMRATLTAAGIPVTPEVGK